MQTRNPEAKLANILGITAYAPGTSTANNKTPESGLMIQT